MNRKKRAQKAREIAKERIERLFDLAYIEHALHPERSDRYVQLGRLIGMRVRTRIPPHLKRNFCKHCGSYLAPEDMRVRLRRGILTITCLRCERQMRYPYWKKSGTEKREMRLSRKDHGARGDQDGRAEGIRS